MKRLLPFLLLWLAAAEAHELQHRIEAAEAVVITLHYANGEAFAYEPYRLTPAGQETPAQVGNTDAHGRIAFVPGAVRNWRLLVAAADGHGANLEFAAPAPRAPTVAPAAAAPRWLLAGAGFALIFGLFGVVQLFARRRRTGGRP